jgi:hypothetical protein
MKASAGTYAARIFTEGDMEQAELEVLVAARKASVVKLKGFSEGTTPEDVANLLWTAIGLNVEPRCISIAPHATPFVTVVLTRDSCADFLQRALQQAGKQIRVEPSNFGLKSQMQIERYAGRQR